MRRDKYLIVIIALILLYVILSLVNFKSNYIIFNDKLYRVKGNNIKAVNNEKINNKNINIVDKDFVIQDGYFKLVNAQNVSSILYDKNYNNINEDQYYYGFQGDIDVLKFKASKTLTDTERKYITKLLEDNKISEKIDSLNYIKTISFNKQRIIMIGNFNNKDYYSYTEDTVPDKYYFEYIILEDLDGNFNIIKKIEAKSKELLDTDYLLFDCIIEYKKDHYCLGMKALNYSFFDGDSSYLYIIKDNKLEIIK